MVTPGKYLVVDECMSSWQGFDEEYTATGLPHVTKIPRKPEGVGAELKSCADGMSGVILSLDIMEGKECQSKKDYEELGAGSAVTLRLTQSYFGSGRIVIADSAFASVKTLEALRFRGLYFMGIVKTASKRYPKEFLSSWSSGDRRNPPERVSHIVLQSICIRCLHWLGQTRNQSTLFSMLKQLWQGRTAFASDTEKKLRRDALSQ